MRNMYSLEDVFLCDPVTKRGRSALKKIVTADKTKHMSLGDFYEHIYVEPYFIYSEKDGESKKIYDDSYYSEKGVSRKNLKERKGKFEDNFLSTASDYLMFIRASAGSGKSIYLNYLKRLRRKEIAPSKIDESMLYGYNEALSELCFDLESSLCLIKHGSTRFPSNIYKISSGNPNAVDSPWHFFNMIIDSIFNISFSVIKSIDDSMKNLIQNNFNKIYGKDYEDEVEDLFKFVCSDKTKLLSDRQLSTELFDLVIKICFIDPDNVSVCITNALSTLTRIIAIKSDLTCPRQLLISFDNIEHFINNNKRIFDEDIEEITNAVVNFAALENSHFESIGLDFANFFKIILVVRDTTSKMLSGDVHSKFNRDDCSIDVTGWFSLEEIYDNKLKFFNIKEDNSIPLKFFKLIVNDSLSKTKNNLVEQISTMYNHNFRRTTRILSRIVAIFEDGNNSHSQNSGIMNFEQFHLLWSASVNMYVKYLCRNAVMRFIFNEISSTGYFTSICNNINNCTTQKNTYAVRILTWLSNKESHETEKYYSYYDLINEVLRSPEVNGCTASQLAIVDFAEVLIALDEHRFDNTSASKNINTESVPNCWCQLLIVKHNVSDPVYDLDAKTLASTMAEHYDKQITNDERYGIRLTEAGNSFAKSLLDFEYFSCQYDKNNLPLVFILDLRQIKATISAVYNNAKKYINNSLFFEYSFFNKNYILGYNRQYNLTHISPRGNKEMQSIPYRIITKHMFYLQQYRKYINNDSIHSKLKIFTREQRTLIIEYVDNYLEKYSNILAQLNNGSYKVNDNIIIKDYITNKDI